MTPRKARALLVLLALAALSSPAAATTGGAPLTNEDVVRLVMIGTGEKDILAALESRAVDFDLSADMVEELRRAGVSDRIVGAMRRRQAAMPAPASVSPTPSPPPGRAGILRLEFEGGAGTGPPSEHSTIALKSLPKGARRRGGMEVGLMTDMALAVMCITADHVPDHWDARSPLEGAPRHELLLFRPGSATDKIKGHEVLYLDHQPSYDIPVPEGAHNIVVAAVGRQAGPGTWRLLESDGARVTILPGRTTRVALLATSQVKGSSMTGFAVDSKWKIAAVEILEGDAAGAAPAGATDGKPQP
jgi:hypothetical protein